MKCNDFPGVVYSRLIAFGKKRENKTHGKISHSTVCVIQYVRISYYLPLFYDQIMHHLILIYSKIKNKPHDKGKQMKNRFYGYCTFYFI